MKFDKKKFLSETDAVLHADYGTDLASANRKELYNALSRAVMSEIYPAWKEQKEADKKRCGYFSAEFLMGAPSSPTFSTSASSRRRTKP